MSTEFKMSEIIDKVFVGFKKITPALVFCCLTTGFILFSPKTVLEKLGLLNIPSIWRTIIGIAFLLFASAITILLLSYPFNYLLKVIKRNMMNKSFEKKWKDLNNEQKAIICTLLSEAEKSGYLCSTSGNTQYLLHNVFIYRPAQFTEPYLSEVSAQKYIYCLQPWVIDLYSKKPDFFDMKMVDKRLIKKA